MTDGELRIEWRADGATVDVGVSRRGTGPTVLLLPALSSMSTRREMTPLQERLGDHITTVAVDWPGFGDAPRPRVDWRPELYRLFVDHVRERFRPVATVAAGHAAGYAIAAERSHPGGLGRLCLLSPTWRGPFPTMAGRRLRAFRWLARSVDLPIAGPVLYRMNVNGPVVRMMTRGHVYEDPDWLAGDRLAQKRAVTDAPGARHAAFRFVTGELDPFADETAFLAAAAQLRTSVLVIYAQAAPRKSKRAMIALAERDGVRGVELPRGKLSFYEEFPHETAAVVRPFLSDASAA
ncbi:alpha/beta fold hydrolase [Marinivivus vitaminiproducens]|uniref:alpha/beta hydrolase n=1 Tax=Marinivivus vitaminiproducens TaxID=3035935 RepID=UPI0027981779|nr:alpha/beta hydrolase [Geminicoccaceae bacterium SCSIO 64248]